MFKKILVPLDGSRLSAKAVPYAIEIASKFDSEVILLQVIKPTSPIPVAEPGGMLTAATAETLIKAAEMQDRQNARAASRSLNNQANKFKKQSIPVSIQVLMGSPAETILELSRKMHIDLVIMTTHGRSGLKRAIMGSVADAVVRDPGEPVLAIRI